MMARKDISDYLVCKAYAERQAYGPWPYEILSQWTGECEKVCYAACDRAFGHGLIDYGVSLRGGFLTDKGKELLMSQLNKA
jgi:hypothetical protein